MSTERFHIDPSSTALLVVDIQDRLAGAMKPSVRKELERQTDILIQGVQALEMHILVTEQYPKGLGPTVPALREVLGEGAHPVSKVEFNCAAADGVVPKLREQGTSTVVLCGMETHICILQTAVGLLAQGFNVWVAEDAVCSRKKRHWASALLTLRDAGAVVVPTESVLFALLKKAGGDAFKSISKLIK